jgi:hypothetical protein
MPGVTARVVGAGGHSAGHIEPTMNFAAFQAIPLGAVRRFR